MITRIKLLELVLFSQFFISCGVKTQPKSDVLLEKQPIPFHDEQKETK